MSEPRILPGFGVVIETVDEAKILPGFGILLETVASATGGAANPWYYRAQEEADQCSG